MSNNKKSSIDFILDKIPNSYRSWLNKYIEQAKEMHKNEIIEAFDEGQESEYQYHINSTSRFDSETYYNETFEK
jgi:acyl-CoA hydrolase